MIKHFASIIIIIFVLLNYNQAKAHTSHNEKLNKLIFDLYRNNQFIGQHKYLFKREDKKLSVKNVINFELKKLGILFYKYESEGKENYIDGELESFESTTKQNKKEKFVKIYKQNNNFYIEGSSNKGILPDDFIIGTWWNHSIVKSSSQISSVSGRIIKQKVNFIGKETLKINNKEYLALKFNFKSSDPSLSKDKKLDINIWYDQKSLIWLKAEFNRQGKWEYRLQAVE